MAMGDISDSMIQGESCGGCGVFFRRAHGFPVLCATCWRIWGGVARESAGFLLATEEEA